MESLIPVINQLQEVCDKTTVELSIDLPRIVVIGLQGSGKSSLIESIVKRRFLPKGDGIVTRAPIVIKLNNVNDRDKNEKLLKDKNISEVAIFDHTDKVFTDFGKVSEEIEAETDRLCGKNGNISDKEIVLTIYSNNVVNLTLVDLPGLAENSVEDQAKDIGTQIRNLVTSYIKNRNSIILAVTPANIDFATSQSIKIAQEVDPDGVRTLNVVTKLDLMGLGTDPLDILSNKLFKLKLGIIGVVNRIQQDIDNGNSIEQALVYERGWFIENYPNLLSRNGQVYLAKRLSELLKLCIKDGIPGFRLLTESLLSEQIELKKSLGNDVSDKSQTIIDLIENFKKAYCGGKSGITGELIGDGKIRCFFHDPFPRSLANIKPLEEWSNKQIWRASRNSAGLDADVGLPNIFKELTIKEICRMEKPSLYCVNQVHDEMIRSIKCCGEDVQLGLNRFPNLFHRIELIMSELLYDRLVVTREAISKLIRQCSAYIDTEHPQFEPDEYETEGDESDDNEVDGDVLINGNLLPEDPRDPDYDYEADLRRQPDSQQDSRAVIKRYLSRKKAELRRCEVIRKWIVEYFDIVRKELEVFVPRAIMLDMINYVRDNMHSVLMRELYKENLFEELLTERDDMATKRKDCNDTIAFLRNAMKIINRIYIKETGCMLHLPSLEPSVIASSVSPIT